MSAVTSPDQVRGAALAAFVRVVDWPCRCPRGDVRAEASGIECTPCGTRLTWKHEASPG
jgi:hypothetical protein